MILVSTFYLTSSSFQPNQTKVRTVALQESTIENQSILDDFDEHTLYSDESGLEFVAKKTFSMSVFDELDLVGLDEEEETFTVRYEIDYIADENTMLMTVIIESADEIPVLETVPGLVSYNADGELDVMFIIDDEAVWLSEMYEVGVIDEVGLFSSLKKLVKKAVNTVIKATVAVATAVSKAVLPILAPAIRAGYNVVCVLGGGKLAAKIGAAVLNMAADTNGDYHASFDCWQQYFGYLDLYDIVFDLTTSMDSRKFPFDIDGDRIDDYILWAWKGDYINLGAGAELGIYKRWAYGDDIWTVDKSLAMKMTLKLDYKGVTIINWQPQAKQWWITGFDPNYTNKNKNDLKATYTVTFTNTAMYNAFYQRNIKDGYGWNFNVSMTPSFMF